MIKIRIIEVVLVCFDLNWVECNFIIYIIVLSFVKMFCIYEKFLYNICL